MSISHNNNVRLSVDLTQDQHIHLKLMATKKGISMREYILDALALKESAQQESKDLEQSIFRSELNRVFREKKDLIKNLSKR